MRDVANRLPKDVVTDDQIDEKIQTEREYPRGRAGEYAAQSPLDHLIRDKYNEKEPERDKDAHKRPLFLSAHGRFFHNSLARQK